jgi:hypothetical protein
VESHGKKHWLLPLLALIKQVGPDVCHQLVVSNPDPRLSAFICGKALAFLITAMTRDRGDTHYFFPG